REARAHHSLGTHLFSRSGTAGDVRLVPWHPEQPPKVLPLLRRSSRLERRDDRDDDYVWAIAHGGLARCDHRLGIGHRQRLAIWRATAGHAASCAPITYSAWI